MLGNKYLGIQKVALGVVERMQELYYYFLNLIKIMNIFTYELNV